MSQGVPIVYDGAIAYDTAAPYEDPKFGVAHVSGTANEQSMAKVIKDAVVII